MKEKTSQIWPMYSKNLVVPQKLAHIRPRRHKHGSIEPSSRKSQQRGGNKSNIPLKQWKRLQMLTMHMLHSKHFFKCNASLDNSYNFKLLRTKNATKTAQNNNTKATATACNSTLDTLVLRKRESWDNRKGRNYHPILNQSHNHVGQFLPNKKVFSAWQIMPSE